MSYAPYVRTPKQKLAFAVIEEALFSAYAGAVLKCRACNLEVTGLQKFPHGCTAGSKIVRATFTGRAIVDLAWLRSEDAERWADACGIGTAILQRTEELFVLAKEAYQQDSSLRRACSREQSARRKDYEKGAKRRKRIERRKRKRDTARVRDVPSKRRSGDRGVRVAPVPKGSEQPTHLAGHVGRADSSVRIRERRKKKDVEPTGRNTRASPKRRRTS